MIRTLDFNAFTAGTVIDDEYAAMGVTVSASGGSNQAMIFDSSNPTGGDEDLASDTLEGLLIISEDGDSSDPDDNAEGGSIFFDFDDLVRLKGLTFKDIEETSGEGTRMVFYDADGNVIDNHYVSPTGDGGERFVQLAVQGVSRFEVRFEGSGAIDNLIFDDGKPNGGGNEAPVTEDDILELDEDTSATVNVLTNDSDPDGDTLTVTMASCPAGPVSIGPGGELTFTPDANFNGDTTITYTVDDGNGGTSTGTVHVTVNPVNDAPEANDDTASTTGTTAVVIPVLANDTDVDGDTLSVSAATSDNGTVTINGDGTITFEANDGFTGDAIINYTVADPDGLTDDAIVTVTVNAGDPTRDGYVDGTAGADMIDTAYTGDPDGDMIDANDEILPGAGPNDDYVRAGAGNDTILAGEGDDIVEAGDGDDSVEGGVGSDTVMGGEGDDVINTGNGDLAPDQGYPHSSADSLGFDPDSDPENDRDYVDGGAGNDTISTGDDRDTIYGGTGDDVINAGIDDDIVDGGDGNDRIVGGEGNDSILGGAGNDTIYAGNDPDLGLDVLDIPDDNDPSNPFSPDRNPTNGMDTVDGGSGDDVIYGADDADMLRGGSGDDYIDGQIDDDIIEGNTGNDTLIGGHGDDSISGGQGNDVLEGGTGNDTLRGNRDDDLLEGGEGDDVLDGGGENDTLMGGDGNDSLQGGQGDDLLDGGAGNDVMTGGAGQDVFVNVNAGDDVDGGSGAIDYDTLDLRGSAPEGGRFDVTYTSADREDGYVDYFNADGTDAGRLNFVEIENVIPCFTPGTKIATPKGEISVEELQVGDRVITRDNGIQTIRWVGAREMTGAEFEMAAHLKPVLIRKGALGNDLPERDMMVSPNHRVLVANDKTALYFEEREVLVAAKHLTGMEGIDVVEVSGTTYIHVMFDRHEVILSDGTWTESFQPGDMSLAGIGEAQRNEILELFPELATQDGIEGYASARRSLKKHEASLLVK